MNLCLHAFLFANSGEDLRTVIKTVETTSKTLEMCLEWKRKSFFSGKRKTKSSLDETQTETGDDRSGISPLGKVHNLAVQVRSSITLFQSWKSATGVNLVINYAAPWKSWFRLIDLLLRRRSVITDWLLEHIDSIGGNHLEKDDWDRLQKTHDFLEVFNEATLKGRLSTFSAAMLTLDALIIHCRQTRVSKTILTSIDISL